jgi:hypothetical protein
MSNNMPPVMSGEDLTTRNDGLLVPKTDLRSRIDGATEATPEEIREAALAKVAEAQRNQPIDPNRPWLTEGAAEDLFKPEAIDKLETQPGDRVVQ